MEEGNLISNDRCRGEIVKSILRKRAFPPESTKIQRTARSQTLRRRVFHKTTTS
jgi:hypothetical protein